MARAKDPADKIIDAALDLAARRPWSDVGLAEIAAAAKLPLSTLRRHFDGKTAIVAALMARTDVRLLDELAAEDEGEAEDEPARDRIFDVMMRRLELLEPHKDGVRAIVADLDANPAAALTLWPAMLTSQRWMMVAAGLDPSGVKGEVRLRGLAGAYGAALRTWLDDDDPGLARTMATLDGRLRRGERWLGRVDGPLTLAASLAALGRELLSGARARRTGNARTRGD